MHFDTLKSYQVTAGATESRQQNTINSSPMAVQRVRATSAIDNQYIPQRAIQWVRVREFRSHDDLLAKIEEQQQQQNQQNSASQGTAQNRIYNKNHHAQQNPQHYTSPKSRRKPVVDGSAFFSH